MEMDVPVRQCDIPREFVPGVKLVMCSKKQNLLSLIQAPLAIGYTEISWIVLPAM